MSYAVSAALQEAVHALLVADPAVTGLVGANVFDAAPPGPLPQTYVVLGEERVADRSDKTARGASHDFTVSVVTTAAGFRAAKDVAVAVGDALLAGPGPALSRGRVVSLQFRKATARREGRGETRRIDLIFRAIVEDD